MEIGDDVRAYKVLTHQHTPEIAQTLGGAAGAAVDLVFTPHLLPLKRGILNTTVATLRPGVTEAQVRAAYQTAFAAEPLVQVLASADAVRLSAAAHTPRCLVGVSVEGEKVVAVSAIDNLLKGAASQAMQNLNLMIGQRETTGLVAGASK
jgi:N-acetyl-gamma-glutamyl-phosphate reductase